MSVTQKIVTKNFNVHSAECFVGSLTGPSASEYFVYVGKHTPYAGGDSVLDTPTDSVQDSYLNVYNDMVFAKRVNISDVKQMIRNIPWVSNTKVYTEYSHDLPSLYTSDFFTVVDDDSEYNVYKCLFNNGNTVSISAPTRQGNESDLSQITTGDGYVWKYMYTITKSDYEKFASTDYVPVTANSDVIEGAVPGKIEVIKIINSGKRYDNYIASAVFKTGDIRVSGSGTTYGAPETASAINDYYRGCVMKIVSGSGAEQYRRIVNYSGDGIQKLFTLDRPFTTTPSVNDTYQVYPYILVWGDGTETTPAEAMAIVDSASSNSISDIEILHHGAGYRYASASVGLSSTDVPYSVSSVQIDLPSDVSGGASFEAAVLKPILSPNGGHGSDPYNELAANHVCVSVKLEQSENGTIPIENDFRQVGIIRNPKYHNVEILHGSAVGNFSVGETVKQYKRIKLLGNVSIQTSNSYITKTDYGKISNTVTIASGGSGYNNSLDAIDVDNSGTGGTGFAASFANNGSGVITSITVTNQGSGYTSPPTLTISGTSGGSSAVLTAALANPQVTTFDDSFEAGDYALVSTSTQNYLSQVTATNDYRVICTSNATFTADNAEISALVFTAEGTVTSVSSGQIALSNVSGVFSTGSKIVGLSSGTTSVISSGATSIQVNDKNAGSFDVAVQLTRLVGDFSSGSTPFIEDELVTQNNLIPVAKPAGYLHHSEINTGTDDDILYISKEYGIFNLDPEGARDIIGSSSEGTLRYLSNKYKGDFVKGSGEVVYYENLDPITRSENKSEIIKIILEF